MVITLNHEMLEKCWVFANQCARTMRPSEHGEASAKDRSYEQIVDDTIVGKLGEIAVQEFFKLKGIPTQLDFDIYDRGQWDDSDINVNGWKIDIKCTKKQGHNFLIEWNKLQFGSDSGELPHYYLMTHLLDDVPRDEHQFRKIQSFRVEVIGYEDVRNLQSTNNDILVLDRGAFIPSTNTKMIAKSFCIPFGQMKNDWELFIAQLENETPFDLSSYSAPGDEICCSLSDIYSGPQKLDDSLVQNNFGLSIKYSLLLSGQSLKQIKVYEIDQLIKQGIRVLVFAESNNKDLAVYRDLKSRYNRNHFSLHQVNGEVPNLKIIDGQFSSEDEAALLELESRDRSFNFQQYRIEHASPDELIIVKASAGTGKTTVMVDRIMFLLATVNDLMPSDIGMITFTNKATASMQQKLQSRLLDLYKLTNQKRWFEYLENLNSMNLSTIDSFFKNFLQTEGASLGYGNNVRLRSFVYEKKKIIRDVINDRFLKNPQSSTLNENILTIHAYEKLVFDIWDKLHSRGYFGEHIIHADFGDAEDERSSIINENLKNILVEAEERYQQLKHESNSYSVADIGSEFSCLAHQNLKTLKSKQLKFLFVDEFQDTDVSQINSLVWLHQMMKCQLFVVGDVKQSIYRFRGAEESAFEELKSTFKQLENTVPLEYLLTVNYRTSSCLLETLNALFNGWSRFKNQLLNWDRDAIAYSSTESAFTVKTNKSKLESEAPSILMGLIKKGESVCVLTRTNHQVQLFADWCHKHHINCRAQFTGNFYVSPPVLHLHALLGALLYCHDTHRLWNVFTTPYVHIEPDIQEILEFNGDEIKIKNYLTDLLCKEGWDAWQKQLKERPFFPFLEDLIEKLNPLEGYALEQQAILKNDKLEEAVEFYRLNLNKILKIIYEEFSGEYATLSSVYHFIDLHVQTNNTEDALQPQTKKNIPTVDVMTVHKAKGLEFETVLLPFMNSTFFVESPKFELITNVDKKGKLTVGWFSDQSRLSDEENYFTNDYYHLGKDLEIDAVCRDEARLLYVATTRAKKHLVVIMPDEVKPNTWAELMMEKED